jgi:L-threonylcarbamoyladenylate synthase
MTEILSPSDKDLETAAKALKNGLLVALPTETVYGLGADAFNVSALAKVFEAKNRPRFDPLIIHIAELDTLSRIVDLTALDNVARDRVSILSKQLWPGPLTLILPKRPEVPDLATAGLPTVAVRFPSHPIAQKLIRMSTGAVAAPSANPFGYISPTRAGHVKTQLDGKVDFIIDGGRTTVGVESTVLDLAHGNPRILRPGGVSKETIEAHIGPVEDSFGTPNEETNQALISPGQLKSHYAPRTPLILYSREELISLHDAPDEGRLYFSFPRQQDATNRTRVLSKTGDMTEAAANLFDMLHELDNLGLRIIRAEQAPNFGLGVAINDRLSRAQND